MDIGPRTRSLAASLALVACLGCQHHRQKQVACNPAGFQRQAVETSSLGDCGCPSCTTLPPPGSAVPGPNYGAAPGVTPSNPEAPATGYPSQPLYDSGPSGHPPDALPLPLDLPDTRSETGPLKPNTSQSGVLPDVPPEPTPKKRVAPPLPAIP